MNSDYKLNAYYERPTQKPRRTNNHNFGTSRTDVAPMAAVRVAYFIYIFFYLLVNIIRYLLAQYAISFAFCCSLLLLLLLLLVQFGIDIYIVGSRISYIVTYISIYLR